MSFITRKVEEKVGLDLNGDGQIGGPGIADKIEAATHVDLNHDGIVGTHRPTADGGLVGKIEKATHVDINKDGYIGGRPGYVAPPHSHKN